MSPLLLIKKIYNKGIFNSFLLIFEIISRKFGISLYSYIKIEEFDKNVITNDSNKQFSYIFSSNSWGSNESYSGKGSEYKYTLKYQSNLIDFLNVYKITSIFDAPCGDFNWMKNVVKHSGIKYQGGDIVKEIVELNNKNYKNFNFIKFDILTNSFPNSDLWHCRDCLFHFSYEDIYKTFKNFCNSKIKYALITNHNGLIFKNINIKTGGFRYLDFRKEPFYFDEPILKIKDYRLGLDFPRSVCLWKKEDIVKFINKIDNNFL